MKKQSATGLFFSMLLRAAVVILGLVIIAFGIFFIYKLIKDGGSKKNNSATTVSGNVLTEAEAHDDLLYETTAATTEEGSEPVADAAASTSYDKNILVLNSTDITGLAGRWCEKLNGLGYTSTTASDYDTLQETTIIYAASDGVGQDLVQYFNGASYQVGTLTSGTSVPTDGYDIIIVLGSNDNDQ